MEKRYVSEYVPSRGVLRACGGIIESVNAEPFCDYQTLAASCVGRAWSDEDRAHLVEAIRLNLVNCKLYPFKLLQRRFSLPCGEKIFRREVRRYVRVLSGLCGFE